MQNTIDFLLRKWNEEYTIWENMPNIVVSDSTAIISGSTFETAPKDKQEVKKFLDELVDAVVVLHAHKRGQRP